MASPKPHAGTDGRDGTDGRYIYIYMLMLMLLCRTGAPLEGEETGGQSPPTHDRIASATRYHILQAALLQERVRIALT